MGSLLKKCFVSILEALLVFFLIVFMPGLPPNMEFTSYSVESPLPYEGPLALNDRLNGAEKLFEGEIRGPEALVSYNGELYTGIHGGEVVKIVGNKLVPVAKFGKSCDGYWEESKCGRPLGLKFDKSGNLYVADAYYGLFKVNIKTGMKTQLVSMDVPIDGKKPRLVNSVDVASDESVYWTDSTTDVGLEDGVYTLLGDGSGRLLKYDPTSNSSSVLLDKIHFANGVLLSPKEDFVLVSETGRSRILRFFLKGPKKGTSDIFADKLPGCPDNLKGDGEGGFFCPLVVPSNDRHPAISHVLAPYPLVRKFLSRLMAIVEMPFQYINKIYPNYYIKRIEHWIGHFESVSPLSEKLVTILRLDFNGKITDSLHCLDRSLSGISDIEVFQDAYYLGSPFSTYIGRVKKQIPRVKIHLKKDQEVKT